MATFVHKVCGLNGSSDLQRSCDGLKDETPFRHAKAEI